MEFAQYYNQEDPLAFDFSSYRFSPEPQSNPQQHYDSSPINPPSAQLAQQSEDPAVSAQKEVEEADASSRPRLTTEQTNVLEEHFQRESKPVTDVKKQLAAKIGLPLDKVNNWYQNRRAKAKHLKKQEILEVMHFHPNPMNMWDYEVISPGFPTGGFRSSDVSTPTQMEHSGFSSYNHTPEQSLHVDLHHQLNYHAWASSQDPNSVHQIPVSYQHADNVSEHQLRNDAVLHSSYALNSTQMNTENPMLSAFSEWGSSQATPAWTPAHQSENPFDDKRLLLQQATVPFAAEQTNHQPISNGESYSIFQSGGNPSNHGGGVQQSQSQRQIHAPTPIQVHQQQPSVISSSPDYSNSVSTQEPQVKAESMSRRGSRGSNSSDLVNGLDTIHLQRVQSHPSSDEEIFKTPPIPSLNLAARRKRQRPAAIGTVGMRSHSCTAPHESSPSAKAATLGPSQSVRRIKSTGNSLNVLNGRVQKSSMPAQRSPLNFQTFHEAGAFDSVDAFSNQPASNSEVSLNSTAGPLTPHTPSVSEDHPMWNKPNHPFESGSTMLNEPTYPNNACDGPIQVTSPPRTPAYTEVSMYNTPSFSHASQTCPPPPQSAPPQLTTFPTYSPPFQPVSTTPLSYFVTQGVADTYGYQQVAPIPPSHVQMYHYPIQPTYYPVLPPQVVHDSPTLGGHYNFQSTNNPPPQKEMEFIIQNFPASKDAAPRPSKSPQQYTEYVFQNSGPGDF